LQLSSSIQNGVELVLQAVKPGDRRLEVPDTLGRRIGGRRRSQGGGSRGECHPD
jgi:hypothetical protein